MISGLITSRDVLRHGPVIVREFGAAAYWRCCMALIMRRKTTFLDCVFHLEGCEAKPGARDPSQRN